MGEVSLSAFRELSRLVEELRGKMETSRRLPLYMEKSEIAELFGVSLHEFNREIEPIAEQVEWEKGKRQKIKPKHMKAIFVHIYGTEEGWEEFFRVG